MNKKTKLAHGGHTTDDYTGAVTTPVYQTSIYLQDDIGDLRQGYEYFRTTNPTRSSVESITVTLESDKYGSALSLGVAAISAAVMLLNKGDHITLNSDIYGDTYCVLIKVFTQFDIEVDSVDTMYTDSIAQTIHPTIKMLFIEIPSNPLLRVTDIKKSAEIAKEHGLISVANSIFTTPHYRNPLDLGIDIVLHSATKYLGGYSDVVAGLVATSDDKLIERLAFISNSIGGILGPQDSYLLARGIKTLGLRTEQINCSVIETIKMLQAYPVVQQVLRPSIESHLDHDVHMAQTNGHAGAITLEAKNTRSAKQLIKAISYYTLAESLGAVEGLVPVLVLTIHASILADIRAKEGITDGLVRISVGIEDTEDLVDDLK